MANNTIKSESFDAFAEDLLAERSAKPLIIVGASKVDDLLLEILRASCCRQTQRERITMNYSKGTALWQRSALASRYVGG
jgi:hypothetical protein